MFKHFPLPSNFVSSLARSYSPLDSSQGLRNLLLKSTSELNFQELTKPGLHQLINNILINNFKGEATLKAKLVDKFINLNVVAAFEIRVNNSRADFLTINGDTKSFEIKSELDNLTKLAKQVSDYEKVFDFNYVVIDRKHYKKALEILPERYGIMFLDKERIVENRKGKRNDKHDVARQLDLFSKKEFTQAFPSFGISKEEVIANFTDQEINERFKQMLKHRYSSRWSFLVNNAPYINPIDYQFFFKHNLAPNIIYEN